ncbi:MAG: TIGR03746 family integrating conjugative element protein [Gammaproteobacteria bacterium]|nr:TIGR03746 family integrating conjugative element protein [Gammaproteobacteria bacterium]
MRRYRLEIDNVRSHLRSLWIVIGLQGLMILALWLGWSQCPKQLRVHVPPDLRSGAVLTATEVPPANVYAFAFYIFQQLNRWSENGATDYGTAIFRISPYLTPHYRNELIADMELKAQRGELAYRERSVHEVPGHGYEERRVDVLAPDIWVVWLDLDLLESVKGMPVKQTTIRYPIRVVRQAIDPETNPWGLALDGYSGEGPRRLTDSELTDPKAVHAGPRKEFQ